MGTDGYTMSTSLTPPEPGTTFQIFGYGLADHGPNNLVLKGSRGSYEGLYLSHNLRHLVRFFICESYLSVTFGAIRRALRGAMSPPTE